MNKNDFYARAYGQKSNSTDNTDKEVKNVKPAVFKKLDLSANSKPAAEQTFAKKVETEKTAAPVKKPVTEIKKNPSLKIINFIVTTVGFVSGIMAIIMGWNDFWMLIKSFVK